MTKNHFYEVKGPFPLSEIAKVVGFNEAISDKNNLKIKTGFNIDIYSEFIYINTYCIK